MRLLDGLQDNVAIKRVKIGFYGESEKDFEEKIASDISLVVFTDEGIEEFRDIMMLPIKQIKDNCIYIFTNGNVKMEEKITRFWKLYTSLGVFDWEGNYDYSTGEPKDYSIEEILEHRKYFEFTSEMRLVG